MKHRKVTVLLACLFTILACSKEPFEITPGVLGDGQLEQKLEEIRGHYDVPALCGILVDDRDILEVAATGVRVDGFSERVTVEDPWHIGSITKGMTATLTARLAEAGLLDWDTSVSEVFTAEEVDGINPAYHDQTFVELFAHVAGLQIDVLDVPSIGDIFSNEETLTDLRLTWALEMLAEPPESTQGTYRYTNAGFIVGGAMIERLTGEPWEDLMQQDVFGALGMTHSGFGAPGTPGQRTAPWGHSVDGKSWTAYDPGDPLADNPPAIGPAGTVYATMTDMASYMMTHIREDDLGGFLAQTSFDRLHSAYPGTEYGYGWSNLNNGAEDVLLHAGSNNRWYAWIWISRTRDIAIFTATNGSGDKANEATQEVLNLMVARYGTG